MSDEQREAALEWLRNYHGSIDSTALMLAHEAGQRLAKAEPVQIDREAVARIVKRVTLAWGGPSLQEFADDPPIRKHYAIADAVIAHLAAQPVTGTSRQQVVLYEVYESDGEPWLFTSDKAAALKALTHAADAGDGGDSYMVERAWCPRTEN